MNSFHNWEGVKSENNYLCLLPFLTKSSISMIESISPFSVDFSVNSYNIRTRGLSEGTPQGLLVTLVITFIHFLILSSWKTWMQSTAHAYIYIPHMNAHTDSTYSSKLPYLPSNSLSNKWGFISTAKLTFHIVIKMTSTSHHFLSAHIDLQNIVLFSTACQALWSELRDKELSIIRNDT